jgi:hypothetical protein
MPGRARRFSGPKSGDTAQYRAPPKKLTGSAPSRRIFETEPLPGTAHCSPSRSYAPSLVSVNVHAIRYQRSFSMTVGIMTVLLWAGAAKDGCLPRAQRRATGGGAQSPVRIAA